MRRAPAALGAACALLVAPRLAGADLPLSGIAIGNSVGALAATLGPPANVTSADSGNRFVFPGGATAYADDDGVVLAVDLQAGNPRIDIDGVIRAFPIGSYSAARADSDLADVAEFTTATLRSYRLAPRRDLVLGFSAATGRLARVVYGEPGQLARLGLLPGDGATKAVIYHAPRLRGPSVAPIGTGSRTSVYRVAVDRSGAVRSVDVVIPSSAPDSDAEPRLRLLAGHYAPATLDGRSIGATVFVQVAH
jgi:hypothetical protein